MNYIKHLTGFFDRIIQDRDLNPTHISLYVSLFQFWNINRFQNPISISREEVMSISKISSKATYHKCMRELHNKGYVKYEPSYNPYKGSMVFLFDLSDPYQAVQKKDRLTPKKLPLQEQGIEPAVNQQCTSTELLPYINNINNLNIVNGQAKKNKDTPADFLLANEETLGEKKGTASGEKIPPLWEAVVGFFMEQNKTEIEAQKFYNHFESNGWLVGGKSKMKDWRAAARNWMLNAQKFDPKTNTPQPNHLHTPNSKNYAEPL